MRGTGKFLFDRSFDADTGQPRPEYTKVDLAAARDAGFDDGRQAGYREAADGEERKIADTMAVALQRLETMVAELDGRTQEITRQAVEAAMMICRKVLPTLARRNALPEVEGMFAECLDILRDEPRVVVRVPGELIEPLQARLDTLAAGGGFDGKLVIMPDDDLAPTDCALVWADGGANRDVQRTWGEIDQAVNRLLYAAADGEEAEQPEPTTNVSE